MVLFKTLSRATVKVNGFVEPEKDQAWSVAIVSLNE